MELPVSELIASKQVHAMTPVWMRDSALEAEFSVAKGGKVALDGRLVYLAHSGGFPLRLVILVDQHGADPFMKVVPLHAGLAHAILHLQDSIEIQLAAAAQLLQGDLHGGGRSRVEDIRLLPGPITAICAQGLNNGFHRTPGEKPVDIGAIGLDLRGARIARKLGENALNRRL